MARGRARGDRRGRRRMSALLLALGAGAVTGLALGALGGGGSVLAVPALIYLLGFTPAAATTASLVVVTVTSATALGAHAREGAVRWRAGAVFAAAGIVPATVRRGSRRPPRAPRSPRRDRR
ncbi:TSUP family transporter, partial [Streptomyces sp. 900105755]